ncbi:F-box domain-containing protein [Caenorhabditis elegans]|uniref:F-box domain-containing protein n=1 Tax=Caenorhabditis elegans TaxID=6239 RepID=O76651_CAEEL|nr:FBA_2 domain-containing protein [Caenorhabditis elegans]CCD65089.1 FBA_2 domain-containing protein [Caenorhabditis elegans]|eukprot:NP_504913.1 Uncharacterized protein CELE_F25E5.5 [Caenorhabditis elegans]
MSENESFPGLNVFEELLDDAEQEVSENKENPEKSKKQEIDELCEFIGGFEKWPVLTDDCKIEVVKYLDLWSRCKLSICSKSDYEIVNKTALKLDCIDIQDNETWHYELSKEDFDNVTIRLQFSFDFATCKTYNLIFSQLGEDVQMRRVHYYRNSKPRISTVINSCNYYEAAVRFAESWLKRSRFEVKEIRVEMSKYPTDTSQIESLPLCKNVRVGSDDINVYRWWLRRVPEDLNSLKLIRLEEDRKVFTIPTDLLELPHVMNVSSFYFYCRAAFTDEQFLRLKAQSMSFDCIYITDGCINEFLKRWINGKGIDGFRQVFLWSTRERSQIELLRGIEARPWDEAFEEEARGFCGDFERVCGRGQCFQISSRIDPYESLTLSISDDSTCIYATGKKTTYEGVTYTDYGIPR